MGVGAGLYMYDVVVKSSLSLTSLLMSSCPICRIKRIKIVKIAIFSSKIIVASNVRN